MRLTTYTDYALRMLIYIALKPDQNVTIGEISKAYGISKNHLMKIASELSQSGYLKAERGRSGGLKLGKAAGQINVGKLVRLTEAGTPLVECGDPKTNTCVITKACKLKLVLHKALEGFYRELEKSTLADLVEEPKALRALFPDIAA